MDHNELLHAHQIALMKADAATDCGARRDHLEAARGFGLSINRLNARRNTAAAALRIVPIMIPPARANAQPRAMLAVNRG